MDGKTMKESNKGKAIKTIHYIGDDIWKSKWIPRIHWLTKPGGVLSSFKNIKY
jgi:hypothetical protein